MEIVLAHTKRYKVIIGSACLFLSASVLITLYKTIQDLILKTTGYWLLTVAIILFGIVMIVTPVVAFFWILKRRVELYNDKIINITLMKNQEINIKDIVSYWSTEPVQPIIVHYLKDDKEYQFYINTRIDPDFQLLKLLKANNIKFNKIAYGKNIYGSLVVSIYLLVYIIYKFYSSPCDLPLRDLIGLTLLSFVVALSFYTFIKNKRKLKKMNSIESNDSN